MQLDREHQGKRTQHMCYGQVLSPKSCSIRIIGQYQYIDEGSECISYMP